MTCFGTVNMDPNAAPDGDGESNAQKYQASIFHRRTKGTAYGDPACRRWRWRQERMDMPVILCLNQAVQ